MTRGIISMIKDSKINMKLVLEYLIDIEGFQEVYNIPYSSTIPDIRGNTTFQILNLTSSPKFDPIEMLSVNLSVYEGESTIQKQNALTSDILEISSEI